MTLQATQGAWLGLKPPVLWGNVPAFTSSVIDATGEKVAFVGRHWNAARATKSIRRVGFLFGTVTKAGGSGLTVSLQNVDTTTGLPHRPDGTPDQTVAIANGDASFASDTWYRTDTLSADRSVAYGELIAVVIEFDGSGRLSSDAVNIKNIASSASILDNSSSTQHFTSSWGPAASAPNVVFEYDDGTFGSIEDAMPCSAITTNNINTGTTPDELALKFQVPYECKIDAVAVWPNNTLTGRDFSVLIDSTTVAVDCDTLRNSIGLVTVPISEITLAANTNYYLSVRPDTASSNTTYDVTVADANHLTLWPGGTTWHLATRTDAGAWSATTTRRPMGFGIRVSAIHDGAGGASGGQRIIGG
jgi:hypothetical protein